MNTILILNLVCAFMFTFDKVNSDSTRYLHYGCNPGEGFNLRRDVYIRVSNLVKHLNSKQKWILVLPPWGGIGYHWKERDMEQSKIPWSKFFDIASLNKHVPVMEYEDYVETIGEPKIDEVWYLQDYAEGVDYENWVDKVDERPCIDPPVYETDSNGKFRSWFWGYDETYAIKFKCVSVQGDAKIVSESLLGKNTTAQSILLDRSENLLHDMFGGKNYWDARRSMIFSKELREIAAKYRSKYLDSNDEKDKTEMPEDWTKNTRKIGDAIGGPYIAAHLRRKDFVFNRKNDIPDLKTAAEKLKSLAEKYNVEHIFVATDGTVKEIMELEKYLPEMVRFMPTEKEKKKLKEGGIAIVDQIICSHAKYFIGTHESTFSFRIEEEREIMGFTPETTYNRFCPNNEDTCEQPTRWKVVWKDDAEMWQ